MPFFEVTETTRYRLYAIDEEEAIDTIVNADDPDQFFWTVVSRGAVELGENE
jgi:hypothetical protein